jgi:hypothetical protein
MNKGNNPLLEKRALIALNDQPTRFLSQLQHLNDICQAICLRFWLL